MAKDVTIGAILRIPPSRLVGGWETIRVLEFDKLQKHPYLVAIVASEDRSRRGREERWDAKDFRGFLPCKSDETPKQGPELVEKEDDDNDV